MLSSIAQGHVDLADILFLIAFIVFCVAFVIEVMIRPVVLDRLCITAGLALIALGWFVL